MSSHIQKLCVYQLKEMYGKCSTIRLTDIDSPPPVLPDIWDFDFEVYVFDNSLRPLGVNMKQVHVDVNAAWPYNIKDYAIDYNPFEVPDKDLRSKFIIYTNQVDNTIPMYINLTSNNSFYLTLDPETPDGMVRAFNPNVYVMKEPFENFECVGGVAMPTNDPTEQDVFEVLKTCKFQEFTAPPPPPPPVFDVTEIQFMEKHKDRLLTSVFAVAFVLGVVFIVIMMSL